MDRKLETDEAGLDESGAQWVCDVARGVTACRRMLSVDLTEWELVSAKGDLLHFLRRRTAPNEVR